jgi:flagellar hook-length control protein FliK
VQAAFDAKADQPTAAASPAPVAPTAAPPAVAATQTVPQARTPDTVGSPDKPSQDGLPATTSATDPASGDVALAAIAPPPTAQTAPTAAASATAPPSPALQVVHAVAGVHVAAGAQGQVTIHLQPGDLGAVQVKIERAPDGTATVTVQVEKSETLQTLQQDISHLHQALDRAGVPTELRQVTLHLAPAGSTAETGTGSGNGQGQGPGSGQQSMGQGPGPGGGFSRGGQPQQQSRDQQATPFATNTDDDAAPHWLPVGVNITA